MHIRYSSFTTTYFLLFVRIGLLCFSAFFISPSVFAKDDADYRRQVFKEVLEALSEEDKELTEQLVEIRLDQEKKLGKVLTSETIETQQSESKDKAVIKPSNTELHMSSTPKKEIKNYPNEGTKDFYAAIGNRFVVGYSFGKTESIGIRVDASGTSKSDVNKTVDGSPYDFYQKNTSFGAYLDWYPINSIFRLTSGINVNDMRTRLNGVANSNLRINGSQVSLGANTFNIEFKFPIVTPYVGFGFIDRKVDRLGFGYFGDVGLMLGKYNAKATTSIIGVQNVTSSDVDTELSNLRKSLFKYSFVPIANFGLTYRYQ